MWAFIVLAYIIYGSKPDFRQFCPPKFCLIRYLLRPTLHTGTVEGSMKLEISSPDIVVVDVTGEDRCDGLKEGWIWSVSVAWYCCYSFVCSGCYTTICCCWHCSSCCYWCCSCWRSVTSCLFAVVFSSVVTDRRWVICLVCWIICIIYKISWYGKWMLCKICQV